MGCWRAVRMTARGFPLFLAVFTHKVKDFIRRNWPWRHPFPFTPFAVASLEFLC